MRLLPIIVLGILSICWTASLKADGETRWIQYKEVDGHRLRFLARFPPDHKQTDRRAAILFFAGGGYESGRAGFRWHAIYFQKRGLVALPAEFRGIKTHGGTPITAMKDAVSAIRWVRKHASELGIDPEKIVLSGGSAGGHLALTPALLEIEEDTDDKSVDKTPAALVLFNPSVKLSDKPKSEYERVGVDYSLKEEICPMLQVREGLPPAVIFHGTLDKAVPYDTVLDFVRQYSAQGNSAVMHTYQGKPHAFYHIHKDTAIFLEHCLKADRFLQGLGLVEGEESAAIANEVISLWRATADPKTP